jgi:hypothetical protein
VFYNVRLALYTPPLTVSLLTSPRPVYRSANDRPTVESLQQHEFIVVESAATSEKITDIEEEMAEEQ